MTQRSSEKVTRQGKSRIPKFKSREQEAKFWDTHSIADFMHEMKPVKVGVAKNLSEGLTIQFDPKTISELRLRAQKRGLGPTQLARMWILEHLQEEYAKTNTR